MKIPFLLKIKMNDEESSYVRIIAGVEKWQLLNEMLVIKLTNGDSTYILKKYIVSWEEVRG